VTIPLLTRRSALSGAAVTVVGGIAGWFTVRATRAAGGPGDPGGTTGAGTPSADGRAAPLLALSRLPAGSVVVLSDARIVLSRGPGGDVHAFSAVCTHQGCTVGVAGRVLQCPCHGSRFAAATGAVTQGPATRPLPGVRVAVRNGEVFRS
jgi:Rieske Fe-S protein